MLAVQAPLLYGGGWQVQLWESVAMSNFIRGLAFLKSKTKIANVTESRDCSSPSSRPRNLNCLGPSKSLDSLVTACKIPSRIFSHRKEKLQEMRHCFPWQLRLSLPIIND